MINNFSIAKNTYAYVIKNTIIKSINNIGFEINNNI